MARRMTAAVVALGLLALGVTPAWSADRGSCVPPVREGGIHPEPGMYVLLADGTEEVPTRLGPDVAKGSALPASAVVLIHGLDDSGEVWRHLAPALREAGRCVLFYEYPNDQGIAISADGLAACLAEARERGVWTVDLVCHSMGGLVARDVLTRVEFYGGHGDGHAGLPDVGRVILIGTPNAGAPLAYVRDAGEVVERTLAWRASDARLTEVFAFGSDGDGQAGVDLRPGSAFLEELNARPAPTGVVTTVIVAQAVGSTGEVAAAGDGAEAAPARGVRARLRSLWSRLVARVVEALGDGAVPTSSAALAGADETLHVRCSHMGLLKDDPVGGWVLDQVGAERQERPAVALVLERVVTAAEGREMVGVSADR